MGDASEAIREAIETARREGQPLHIRGGDSKAFLLPEAGETRLEVSGHRGILHYEPTELVVTARAGTTLAELEQALAAEGQMLPFEPPRFSAAATLGGTVACNLSGPRRPHAGAVRDFVLGCRIINGRGEPLRFGGEVMKNVAGYDASRLMCGAFGTLGVLLEVSLKVLPRPAAEITLVQERDAADAIRLMNLWAGRPLPLSAACHDGEHLFVRLSGSERGVRQASRQLGGEPLPDAHSDFWERLRDQRHPFFDHPGALWRLSVPPATPLLDLPGPQLIDWSGAQRWIHCPLPAHQVRAVARAAGGHASQWRGPCAGRRLQEPAAALLTVHRRLKAAFDPDGLFNPGYLFD